MAINPQTLFDESKCYLCFEISEDEALELALLARIASTPVGPVAPSVPTNLLVRLTTTLGNNILDWTASAGTAPTTYEIWRSVNGGAYAQVGTVAGGVTTFTHAAAMPANDQWYYEVRACTAGLCSSFTDPAGIFNTFVRTVNTGTVVYSFPFLQFVFGNFFIASELALTTVSTPRLRKTTGVYLLQNNDVMTNFDASSLISGDGVGVVDSAIITTASFPALTTAGAFFAIRDNPALVTATAPLLATIATGPFQFTNTTVLSTLVLPSLTTIGTDIMGAASGVASISFIALTAVGGSVTCGSCVALVDVNWPNVIFQDGTLIDFTGDVLNNTSVNMVLARGVASGTTTSDYELNNPGNAAPNGQGLLDKATLIGLGNTVNTN